MVSVLLGAVVEPTAGIAVVESRVSVVVDVFGVLGGSVVVVRLKFEDEGGCAEEAGIIVTAVVMVSGDTVVIFGDAVVVVNNA